MTSHATRPRRIVAAVAVMLLVAAIPGLAAATAASHDTVPEAVVVDDACNDVPDAGFTDVPDSNTFADLIDCLAAYGITQGTGDGSTYEPGRGVRRWEMAVFIARLATIAAGQLDELTLPDPAATNFTDIDQLSDEAQDAISVLNQVGVVEGTTDTTYSPYQKITRGQMASFVDRLQGAIQAALGLDPDGFSTDKDFFGDDDGNTHEQAINDIASVGIVQGFADGTYRPSAPVTRGQMAAFIMRHVEVNIDLDVLTSAFPPLPPNCDPNYRPCVPIASDVDCAGGTGDGPRYVEGPVDVVGDDVYDLDADNDGVGCED